MTIPRCFSRRFALGCAALLLGAAPLVGFAASDAVPSIRSGQTRAELEKSIGAELVEDSTSIYRNAYKANQVTEALRGQLPPTLSKLDFEEARFYFDDAGQLWRVRLQSRLPANEAFALMVATTNLLERDTRHKRVPQHNSVKKLSGNIPAPRVCYDENSEGFKVKPKDAKLLASRWKSLSPPERHAATMNLNCDAMYLTHRFVTPTHTWTSVNFESSSELNATRMEEALPKMTQVFLTYLMVQASAAIPDPDDTDTTMEKTQ